MSLENCKINYDAKKSSGSYIELGNETSHISRRSYSPMWAEFCPPLVLVTEHYEEKSINSIYRDTLVHVSSSVNVVPEDYVWYHPSYCLAFTCCH